MGMAGGDLVHGRGVLINPGCAGMCQAGLWRAGPQRSAWQGSASLGNEDPMAQQVRELLTCVEVNTH